MALRLSTNFRNNLLKVAGESACDTMAKGCIEIRTGGQPSTADDAVTGTLLARITLSSGDYTNLAVNGIDMKAVAAQLNIADAQVWSGLGLADNVAGWFRFFDTTYDGAGGSTSGFNIDGAVATSGAQLNLPNTNITVDGTVTVDSLAINFPTA